MADKSISIVMFCTLFVLSYGTPKSKFRKLESTLNLLQTKLTMLENKVFIDELDFRSDIDMIMRQLNNTNDSPEDAEMKAGFISSNENEVIHLLEKVQSILGGIGKEKQYMRTQLNKFELALSDMKRQQEMATSGFIDKVDKRLTAIENEVFTGKEFMNRVNEEMKNEVSLIKQNVSKGEKSLSVVQRETVHVIDELKQQIAGNKLVIAELSNKLETIQNKVSTINVAPIFDCGTWDRFGLSCYKFFDDEVEWEIAVEKCTLEDAHLIEVDSSAENTYVVNFTKARTDNVSETSGDIYDVYDDYYSNYEYVDLLQASFDKNTGPWLGASDKRTEGKWVWEQSGRNVNRTYQGWYDGEPNGKTKENCLHLFERLDYQWNDVPCNEKKPYVCEKSVTVK